MRLDKFLKVSRIIKRRTVAKKIANKGRILINDRVAKSSSNVAIGDVVTIKFGNKTLTIKIKALLETTKKDVAEQMYDVVSETYAEKF